jgi:glycosyltransferase involved in cell wall biosynthesis
LSVNPLSISRSAPLYFSEESSELKNNLGYVKKPGKTMLRRWPKISIVLPSFNQATFVRQSLDSIFSQKYPNLETIVLDPGSTDGTREILAEYKDKICRLILEPDNGQSDALERGLNMAQGEILTWLCTDDMLEPDSLFYMAEAFMHHKTDIVVGGCRRIDEDGREIHRHYSAMPFNQVVPMDILGMTDVTNCWLAGYFFYQPEVFFTQDIWRRAGAFFHKSSFYGMDYDLWVRMALAGGRGVQISHFVAASREQKNQKTDPGQLSFVWQFANFLRHYNKIITTGIASLPDGYLRRIK